MPYDVADPPVSLVSAPEKHDTFCLALEHYLYIRLPLRGGLDLLYALTFPGSMISIVSMVRRSNVLVTFLAGALFFHEKNLKSKAIDLFLVLLGMIFLYLGTR